MWKGCAICSRMVEQSKAASTFLPKKVSTAEWASKGAVKTSGLSGETKNQLADCLAKANQHMNHHLKMVWLG